MNHIANFSNRAKVLSKVPLCPNDGKWIQLTKITWEDPDGKERTWEAAERQTRPSSGVDGIGVIGILNKEEGPVIIIQKEFRPPTGAVCVGLPSGLIEESETPEHSAERELFEETGYHGKALYTSWVKYNGEAQNYLPCSYSLDPGFSNCNMRTVTCEIDLKDERNKNPKPQLEDGEYIEAFTVPLKTLGAELGRLEKEGCVLEARLASIALGIWLAEQYGLN